MLNKKGFSLLEMLVVIAVIAVLVSIIVPIIGDSTIKSAAATNASNLRSMEGKLNVMMIQDGSKFETLLGQINASTQAAMDAIGNMLFGSNYTQEMKAKLFCTKVSADGILTLWDATKVENVPGAAEIHLQSPDNKKIHSVNVEKGDQMTILVAEKRVYAFYGNDSTGYYSVDNFADIAEDGRLDGKVSSGVSGNGNNNNDKDDGPNIGDVIGGAICTITKKHNFQFGKCTMCGKTDPDWCECVDVDKSWGYIDGECDNCGSTVYHPYVDESGGGCNSDEPNDKCDRCNQSQSAACHKK